MPVPCPSCSSEYTYEDNDLVICPMCAHEWAKDDPSLGGFLLVVNDANGNPLANGDAVTVIKDLKLGSSAIKKGTKAKGIRLIDPNANNGHDIDCKIDGFGAVLLKSSVVRKL